MENDFGSNANNGLRLIGLTHRFVQKRQTNNYTVQQLYHLYDFNHWSMEQK